MIALVQLRRLALFASLAICLTGLICLGFFSVTRDTSLLPDKVDLTAELSTCGITPLAQGRRDTCGVFSITTLAEYEQAMQIGGSSGRLSEEYLVWAAREASGKTREQAFFYELVEGINRFGICTAKKMPYARTFDPERLPSEDAVTEAQLFRECWRPEWIKRWSYDSVLTDTQLEQIKHTLAQKHLVAIGVRWPKKERRGRLLVPPAASQVFDGHVITLVGYEDDKDQPGGGTFRFLNSYGPRWGKRGYGVMSYDYARIYANDVLWLRLGRQNGEVPTHRFEAESMTVIETRECETRPQNMSSWEGPLWSEENQLFCQAESNGSLRLGFEVPKAGRYRVRAITTAAPDYGIVRGTLDGNSAGQEIDLYAGRVCPAGSLEIGLFNLSTGKHYVEIETVARNAKSKGFSFGLDAIDLIAE